MLIFFKVCMSIFNIIYKIYKIYTKKSGVCLALARVIYYIYYNNNPL